MRALGFQIPHSSSVHRPLPLPPCPPPPQKRLRTVSKPIEQSDGLGLRRLLVFELDVALSAAAHAVDGSRLAAHFILNSRPDSARCAIKLYQNALHSEAYSDFREEWFGQFIFHHADLQPIVIWSPSGTSGSDYSDDV